MCAPWILTRLTESSSYIETASILFDFGNDTFSFKTPSSGGSGLVVSGASQPTLKSGVTVADGTSYFSGLSIAGGTVSGGSSVSLSSYTGGSGGPGGWPGGWR